MHYLRTMLATDWQQGKGPHHMLVRVLSSFVPEANPGYKDKMHLIREWYVEFDANGHPYREIGLDERGMPVVAGPSNSDNGFWLDTNMRLEDFDGTAITREAFEEKWFAFEAVIPK